MKHKIKAITKGVVLGLGLVAIAIAASSCAQTAFYRDGKIIARFQGDMTKVQYSDGPMQFAAESVNHSKATTAGGNATSKGIIASGTAVATSGILTTIK